MKAHVKVTIIVHVEDDTAPALTEGVHRPTSFPISIHLSGTKVVPDREAAERLARSLESHVMRVFEQSDVRLPLVPR